MRPGRAADHSTPSSAAVMEEYSYASTHLLGHTGPVTGSLYRFYNNLVCAVLQIGRSLVRSQMVSLEFFIDIILSLALWPWGQLTQPLT